MFEFQGTNYIFKVSNLLAMDKLNEQVGLVHHLHLWKLSSPGMQSLIGPAEGAQLLMAKLQSSIMKFHHAMMMQNLNSRTLLFKHII